MRLDRVIWDLVRGQNDPVTPLLEGLATVALQLFVARGQPFLEQQSLLDAGGCLPDATESPLCGAFLCLGSGEHGRKRKGIYVVCGVGAFISGEHIGGSSLYKSYSDCSRHRARGGHP